MSEGRARFTSTYTQAQKDAVLASVLIDGRSVPATIKLAAKGELGVPAFEIGRYCYQLVKFGRDAFEANNDDALTAAIEAELLGAERDALANLRAIRRGNQRDGQDNVEALARATKALSAIRRARREANTGQKPRPSATKSDAEPVNTPKTDSVVASLLKTVTNGAQKPVRSTAR